MSLSLNEIIEDFAVALLAVDADAPVGASKTRTYRPGVGPLTEAEGVRLATRFLRDQHRPDVYWGATPRPYPGRRQQCDLVIPGEWALEFKLLRPFNDNGAEAEHWSENIIHPYPGNVSSVGDVIKLAHSGFPERKGIVLMGYEHTPPMVNLTTTVEVFELIVRQVIGIGLGPRYMAEFGPLIHPIHQQGVVIGWEVIA